MGWQVGRTGCIFGWQGSGNRDLAECRVVKRQLPPGEECQARACPQPDRTTSNFFFLAPPRRDWKRVRPFGKGLPVGLTFPEGSIQDTARREDYPVRKRLQVVTLFLGLALAAASAIVLMTPISAFAASCEAVVQCPQPPFGLTHVRCTGVECHALPLSHGVWCIKPDGRRVSVHCF